MDESLRELSVQPTAPFVLAAWIGITPGTQAYFFKWSNSSKNMKRVAPTARLFGEPK
jgi:hypothetical protein